MRQFQLFQDTQGYWRWRLVADNGQVIATSGEAFFSRSNAVRAAHNVAANAGGTPIAAQDTLMEAISRMASRRRRRAAASVLP